MIPSEFLMATGVDLANQGIVALLGRDFLAEKVLVYNGWLATVTLSY
jgi:hypothetical protein